jgi:hypothetical protein
MEEESREHQARLIAVWIPIQEQVDDDRWYKLKQRLGVTSGNRSRPQEVLSQVAAELKLDTVDLLPFFQRRKEGKGLYYEIDGHWTPEGHRAAAEALAPALQSWRQAESGTAIKNVTVPGEAKRSITLSQRKY